MIKARMTVGKGKEFDVYLYPDITDRKRVRFVLSNPGKRSFSVSMRNLDLLGLMVATCEQMPYRQRAKKVGSKVSTS